MQEIANALHMIRVRGLVFSRVDGTGGSGFAGLAGGAPVICFLVTVLSVEDAGQGISGEEGQHEAGEKNDSFHIRFFFAKKRKNAGFSVS
jgi:hypothetical protein